MIEIPLSKTGKHAGKYVAIVDDCDADLAELNWCVTPKRYTHYAIRFAARNGVRLVIILHRVILSRKLGRELLSSEFVDHINRDGLDNRRENLRLATISQNQANQRMSAANTSGYRGVSKNKDKWSAEIRVDNKAIRLGHYNTPEEAHKAYCKAAKKYFGEFASATPQNGVIK